MTVAHVRPRTNPRPQSAWRQRTPSSVLPFAEAADERGQIAFVFSLREPMTAAVSSALTSLQVTTVVRSFDADAVRIVAAASPDVVVLACDPSHADAIQAIGLLAEESSWHLLVLDTSTAATGTPAALDAGADTVLSVDAETSLIRATLRALLRRRRRPDRPVQWPDELETLVGTLTVDKDTFEVRDAGELVRLTPTEFKVVAHLAGNAGFVRSASQIMAVLHDYPIGALEARETVRVYIRRIRNKLAGCERPSVEIVSYRGRGYRLEPTDVRDEPLPFAPDNAPRVNRYSGRPALAAVRLTS